MKTSFLKNACHSERSEVNPVNETQSRKRSKPVQSFPIKTGNLTSQATGSLARFLDSAPLRFAPLGMTRAFLPVGILVFFTAIASAAEPTKEQLDFFEGKIRPLLADKCYKCHSAESEKSKGGLTLDTREGTLKGGDDGPAVVPGDLEKSRLLLAVGYTDSELQMPPKKEGGKLSDAQIADLTAWVKMGAPDPRNGTAPVAKKKEIDVEAGKKWWAFQPLKPVAVPKVADTAWPRTPVDNFILAKLDAKNIAPNPAAEKRVLIRRVYFDLIGLPPTPEEIEAFAADNSPNAYENLIDRLLASPHYGERWARHWLDLARFAESHGYEQDYDRPFAFHYRDFVIQALNADLPYDKFVKWQIAGDELEPDNLLAWKATGFLAAGTHATQITANQAEKERYDELDDMAATIGTSMLGLTVGCARCHDHKYDPIAQTDYFRIVATFTKTVRSDYELPLDPEKARSEQETWDREHARLVAVLKKAEGEILPARLAAWEKTGRRPESHPWILLSDAKPESKGKAIFTPAGDGSFLVSGDSVDFDEFTFTATAPLGGITGVKLDALADKSLPQNGPGRADNGNFALTDFTLTVKNAGAEKVDAVKFVKAVADFEQKSLEVAKAIDADSKSGWAVDGQIGKDHSAVFIPDKPLTSPAGSTLTFTLRFDNNQKHAIGRPRLAVTTAPKPSLHDDATVAQVAAINQILDLPAAQRTAAQTGQLLAWYRPQDAEWQKLNTVVAAHQAKAPKPAKVKVLVSSEGLPAVRLHTQGPDFFEKTYVVKRGDPNQKLGEANPGFLRVLMRAPDQEKHWQIEPPQNARTPMQRTALANWITDVDCGAGNLLARVIVNRLWQHHFGRGLVATPSDFGAQGDAPTHPELLDFLAAELIRNGWRLNPVHKLILSSATYMQGDATDSARMKVDPDNALWWHRSPQRLEAEGIRDSILAVSGDLDKKMFGPGSLDEGMKRRSIYFTVKRSRLIPMMTQFDWPDSLQGMGRRVNTTVAPQALLLMNNPHVRDAASNFAKKITAGGTDPGGLVARAYRTALGRAPSQAETADGAAFLASQTAAYTADKKPDAQHLAVTDFCQAVFSLNEFIYAE